MTNLQQCGQSRRRGPCRRSLPPGPLARKLWVSVALLAAAQACAVEPAEDMSDLEVAVSPLWTPSSGVEYWPDNRVQVCFGAERWTTNGTNPYFPEPAPTGSTAWVRQTTRIREVLESSYETIPGVGLDFHGFQVCPAPEVGTFTGGLRITVRDGGSFNWAFRHCGPGEYYSPAGCESRTGYASTKEAHIVTSQNYKPWGPEWDGAVIHEVAHALGFKHEFDRNDRPAQDCRSDSGGQMSGRFLTLYDHGSITNFTYCGAPQITALDMLGLEIIYPRNVGGHTLTGRNSFRLGDGLVLVRTDDVLITDWTARGALPGAYDNGTARWFRGGTLQSTSLTYPTNLLPAGVSTVKAEFNDPRGRLHTSVDTRVEPNNALHTVLIAALLP